MSESVAPKENVWDYPRPPRLEPVSERITIILHGEVIVDTRSGFRVLETSHPPSYYIPRTDVSAGTLRPAAGGTLCEWKGRAIYFDIVGNKGVIPRAAWSYPDPTEGFRAIAGHVAFYAGPMDACRVGEALVTPQPGGFYGGWITPGLVGPFKGVPGSAGW
jgi:uncharacterized protein (DUF427 family)